MATASAPSAGAMAFLGRIVGSWSPSAALRAVRAAVLIPALLAIAFEVIGNSQLATYAVFGGFANLVLASFPGGRWHKFFDHLVLGIAGAVLLTIGTAARSPTALAAVVTLVVSFAVLLTGGIWAGAGAGALAAMLAYVLSAASPGTTSMIGSRIEGWWLATAAAAIAVALTSPRRPAGLRVTVNACARALAREIASLAEGSVSEEVRSEALESTAALRAAFNAAPSQPTGLARRDRAIASLIELLEWTGTLLDDAIAEATRDRSLEDADQELLRAAAQTLSDVAETTVGNDVLPDIDRLERLRVARTEAVHHIGGDPETFQSRVHAAFHARTVAVAVRSIAADALVATGHASAEEIDERRMSWLPRGDGEPEPTWLPIGARRAGIVDVPRTVIARYANIRSVSVRNSLRGALAVTAAVTIADLLAVQHGFWVVLGTLAVLRTSATATGGNAVRAVVGTSVGFVIGAALLLAIGTDTTVLWAVLPVAVLIAAYTPGVAPFAVGQAAFTILLVLLYNLLLPVGWKVGVIRLEDVAIGCGVSLVVGTALWPRGATSLVAADLSEALVDAGRYFGQAAGWALGLRQHPPDTARAALFASLRLDDAIRVLLTEPAMQAVPKEDLWTVVGAAQRLRLTSAALAELPAPPVGGPLSEALHMRADELGDWYGMVATHIQHNDPPQIEPLAPLPPLEANPDAPGHRRACQIYVDHYLRHLYLHHRDVIEPAEHLAAAFNRSARWRSSHRSPPVGEEQSGHQGLEVQTTG